MPTDDRDRQLERALARHLSDSRDAACPDVEILAAYHERTLSLEEMAEWKEHIASCSRCQEALVLIEESEKALAEDRKEQEVEDLFDIEGLPASEAQAAPLRSAKRVFGASPAVLAASAAMPAERGSRLNWRWVAPVGALAAAVIVWIGVRDIKVANQAAKLSNQIAQNREALPPSPSRLPSDEALRRQQAPAPKAEVPPNPTNRSPAPTVPEPYKKEEQVAGAVTSVPPKAAPSEQKKSLEFRDSDVPNPTATESAAPPHSEARKSRAAAAGAPANEPAATDKLQPLPPSAQSVQAASTLNTSQSDLQVAVRDSKDLMRLAAEDHRLIVAPGQKSVWRVGEGGLISQSADGGQTWTEQNSGVTADLTSGSATSDKVAWVAGKSGTLLLTADGGKQWKQIATPIAGDLGGVHAIDRTHASIWDVPNRKSFLTSDGGKTWKPAANE